MSPVKLWHSTTWTTDRRWTKRLVVTMDMCLAFTPYMDVMVSLRSNGQIRSVSYHRPSFIAIDNTSNKIIRSYRRFTKCKQHNPCPGQKGPRHILFLSNTGKQKMTKIKEPSENKHNAHRHRAILLVLRHYAHWTNRNLLTNSVSSRLAK